jgi:hypothetical protein
MSPSNRVPTPISVTLAAASKGLGYRVRAAGS